MSDADGDTVTVAQAADLWLTTRERVYQQIKEARGGKNPSLAERMPHFLENPWRALRADVVKAPMILRRNAVGFRGITEERIDEAIRKGLVVTRTGDFLTRQELDRLLDWPPAAVAAAPPARRDMYREFNNLYRGCP
jgi:hypothetical protein